MRLETKFVLTSALLGVAMGAPMVANADSKVEMKVVRTDSLNIRDIQDQSKIVERIKEGSIVKIIKSMEKQPGWYYVQTSSGKKGVCSGAYLSRVTNTSNQSNSSVYYTKTPLNVRTGPSTTYPVLRTVAKDTKLEKISESNGWAKVKIGNQIGYCSAAYLQGTKVQSSTTNNNQSASRTYYVVNTDSLSVRTGPSTIYKIYKKVATGTELKVLERRSDGWSKIIMDGKCVYVSSRYISQTKPSMLSSYSYLCGEAKIPTSYISKNSLINVKNALSKIDGKVIQPGAEFDYLKSIGPLTKSNGYVNSTVISGGVYSTDIAGGICAGSTIIHNAVMKTGLKVTERRNHSLPSSYVKKGMDAMVTTPLTYRFKNTSNHPIRIRTYVSDGYIVAKLESTADIKNGYTYVPEVDVSSDGLKATTTVWKMKNGVKVKVHQKFYSTYKKA